MLEPKGPTHLAPGQTGWPVPESTEPMPPALLSGDELARLRELINRVGVARVHQLVEYLTADTPVVVVAVREEVRAK
jgi:hypothetical protein